MTDKPTHEQVKRDRPGAKKRGRSIGGGLQGPSRMAYEPLRGHGRKRGPMQGQP